MTRARQQLAVLMLSHFLSAFLYDTAQPITSSPIFLAWFNFSL
jgi:hypothetical protein